MNKGAGEENKKTAFYGNALYIHLKEFDTFDEDSQPWMQVRFFPGHMEFLRHGAERPYKMDYPEPLQVLAAMVKGKGLLLIGKTNLWEINLEQVFFQPNKKFLRGSRGRFFQKAGGTRTPFTVSQMPFFRSFISKVCRKNKVSLGISKKIPLADGGRFIQQG